jgi:hypothetical protein
MCSMALFAYLRIGKITKQTNNASCQPLQMDQISYVYDSSHKVVGIKLTFLDFKHNYNPATAFYITGLSSNVVLSCRTTT